MKNSQKTNALTVENLNISYNQLPVVSDLSINVPGQTFCAIIGPNGAGKSSLLKATLNLIPIDSGKIQFFNTDYKQQQPNVAYVAQRQEIDWDFPITVREVVAMGRLGHLKWWQRLSKQDNLIIDNALKRLEISDLQHRQISKLSGGQQQRMFIARALTQQSTIYLLDEPFAGIDANTEKSLVNLFKNLVKDGMTIIAVHHDLSTAPKYFDYAILINQYLIAQGYSEDTLTNELLKKTFSSYDNIQVTYNQTKKNKPWPKHG